MIGKPLVWVIGLMVCVGMMGALRAGAEGAAGKQAGARHTASVTFQVLPPTAGPGQGKTGAEGFSVEEIGRFVRRQVFFIRSNEVVDRILESDEFQHDASDKSKKSPWLIEHADDPRKHLLEDMEVAAVPNSDLFTITMTGSNAAESARLVNAITRVYQDSLRMSHKIEEAQRLEELSKLLARQEGEVKRLEGILADFCKAHDLDMVTPRNQIALNVLGQLESDQLKAEARAAAAKDALAKVAQQVQAGTLTLSLEMAQYVENDPRLRMLEQAKLQLDMDQAAQAGAKGEAAAANQRRGEVVEKQMRDRREELVATAKIRTQEQAETESSKATAELQYLSKKRDEKSREIEDIAYSMVQAQKRTDELKTQQGVLTELRQVYTLEQLKSASDDTRVRKLGGDAVSAGR